MKMLNLINVQLLCNINIGEADTFFSEVIDVFCLDKFMIINEMFGTIEGTLTIYKSNDLENWTVYNTYTLNSVESKIRIADLTAEYLKVEYQSLSTDRGVLCTSLCI